jgi:hypothetical protein
MKYYTCLAVLLFACQSKVEQRSENPEKLDSTYLNGYNELADESDRETLTTSEFNTDLESAKNIKDRRQA